jgi:hypothetical protein
MTSFGNIIYYSMLFAALGFLLKCTGPDEATETARITASVESCSLVGTWARCISNGTASGRITFIASENLISQKTDTFLSNPLCAGMPDGESITDITYTIGPSGKSTFIRDGTDIDLTSSTDLGCGSDVTVYSVIKFTEDCTHFFPVQMLPGCKPSERGLIIDTIPFERQ